MGGSFLFTVLFLFHFIYMGHGLQCYSCAHVESGDLGLIDGFADASVDASCQWGRQPNNKFLVNCTANEEPGYRYSYTCMEMRIINGTIRNQENAPHFNGTLWGCGTRRFKGILADNECQQGVLAVVTRDFRSATGKEFLQNMSAVFNDVTTRTKVCACDVDACWAREEGGGGGSSSTNSPTGSTEKDSGYVVMANFQFTAALGILTATFLR